MIKLNGEKQKLNGYTNIDPITKFDDIAIDIRNLDELVSEVSAHGYNQVLVECGPTLGNALLRAGFIDELIIYRSPNSLGADGLQLFEDERALLAKTELISQIAIGPDAKSHYFITKRGD